MSPGPQSPLVVAGVIAFLAGVAVAGDVARGSNDTTSVRDFLGRH